MSMSIHSNMSAIFAQRQFETNSRDLNRSQEQLSTGRRINRGKDDAAGLGISEKMRTQIHGLRQAQRNAHDALSLVATAEGGIQETTAILQRMRTLIIQAATDTYTTADRELIQIELEQLKAGLDTAAGGINFNGRVLNAPEGQENAANLDKLKFSQTYTYTDDGANGTYDVDGDGTDDFTAEDLAVYAERIKDMAKQAARAVWGRTGLGNPTPSDDVDVVFYENTGIMPGGVIASAGATTLNINLSFFLNHMNDPESLVSSFSAEQIIGHETTHILQGREDVLTAGIPNWITEGGAEFGGNAGQVRSENLTPAILDGLENPLVGLVSNDYAEAYEASRYIQETYGNKILADFYRNLEDGNGASVNASRSALLSAIRQVDPSVTTFAQFESNFQAWFTANGPRQDLTDGSFGRTSLAPLMNQQLWVHVGANQNETVDIKTYNVAAGALDMVSYVYVKSRTEAERSIDAVDRALGMVGEARAELGAVTNRLQSAITKLGAFEGDAVDAESRVRDADLAQTMTDMTRQQIKSQVATSMIAQANIIPQAVLQLLQG